MFTKTALAAAIILGTASARARDRAGSETSPTAMRASKGPALQSAPVALQTRNVVLAAARPWSRRPMTAKARATTAAQAANA